MPLQDSFSSRRPSEQSSVPHAPKPNRLPKPPSREDLQFTYSCAVSNPQVPLGLLWKMGERTYLLTVMASVDAHLSEPAWVLHSGTDAERTVLWSYRSSDLGFIQSRLLGLTMAPPSHEIPALGTASGDFPAWAEDIQLNEMVLLPGVLFAEHYEIVKEIGFGGMGIVYKALDRQFNREVAVKVLHGHLVSDPISKKRFEQEARAAMTLSHPNLISVYHYGFSDQGLPFLVMEFIDGYGLDDLLRKEKQLEIPDFTEIFIQSCEGLAHAHQKGIIHRDLKPSNIMLLNRSEGRSVKIVDFGIAKLLSLSESNQDLTMAGDLLGSPLYMSPEQCKGDPLDVRSDIYSLGCLMYHAAVGVVPFEGETPLQTLGKHICDTPPAVGTVRPGTVLPPRLQNLIFKALEKAPENRFDSVLTLQQELTQLRLETSPARSSDSVAPAVTTSQLLVDAGDLPATTLDAAVKVQEMLRAGSITLNQAANALGRAHLAGGKITAFDTTVPQGFSGKGIETPVEAILLEAGLITNTMWRLLLSIQQRLRSGQISREEAVAEIKTQPSKVSSASLKKVETLSVPKDVLEMIRHSGIVSDDEIDQASRIANEEGTELAKRLVAMGQLDNKTLLSARQCLSLVESGRLRLDRAVIALLYCHRCRVGVYEAVQDMGWERP